MTTWQLIKKLMRGSRFRWRHLLVWAVLIAALGIGYSAWHKQNTVQAAVQFFNSPANDYVNQVNLDIVVKANGQVVANGKDLTKTLKILPNFDEISVLAIDSPGSFIGSFQAIVHLPQDVQPGQVKQIMYAVHGVASYNSGVIDSRTLFYTAENISSQASITIVADLPKDIVKPSDAKQIMFALAQIPVKSYLALAVALPIITLIIMAFMVIRRRQDQIFSLSNKIVSQAPSVAAPAIVGTLMDGRVGAREVAATLIDLAARGYLYITRHPDESFSFGKRKTLALEKLPELRDYERMLLTKIFEPEQYRSTNSDVEARVGRHIFSRKIAEVYMDIYNETMRLGYFVKDPVKVHLVWRFTGIGSFFLGLLGFFYTAFYGPDPKYILFFWVGQMAAAVVIILLSGLMPARSVTGTTALRAWLQFRHYLSLPQAIEGAAGLMDRFSAYLSYAIVFGVEIEWAKRFSSSTFAKPDWYESEDAALTIEIFAGQLFPLVSYVGTILDKSHEPTVE